MRIRWPQVVVVVVAATSPAAAQEVGAPPEPRPVFFLLAPDGAANEVGGELTILVPDEGDSGQRVNLQGQYVDPASGVGGYGTFSFARAEDESGIGNLELGGLYRLALAPELDLAARLGVTLPTNRGEDADALTPYIVALLSDPSDLVTGVPDLATVRAAVSPTFHQQGLFLRLDAGVDVPVGGDNAEDLEPVLHLDVAGGFVRGAGGVAVEVASARFDSELGDPQRFHQVAITGQFLAAGVALYGGVGVPMWEDEDVDLFNVFLGARGRL